MEWTEDKEALFQCFAHLREVWTYLNSYDPADARAVAAWWRAINPPPEGHRFVAVPAQPESPVWHYGTLGPTKQRIMTQDFVMPIVVDMAYWPTQAADLIQGRGVEYRFKALEPSEGPLNAGQPAPPDATACGGAPPTEVAEPSPAASSLNCLTCGHPRAAHHNHERHTRPCVVQVGEKDGDVEICGCTAYVGGD